MNQNSNIISNRTKRIQMNEQKFSRFISSSATRTIVFDENFIFPAENSEKILTERTVFTSDSDSISAVFTYSDDFINETNKIAILDFADYGAPAGSYKKGDVTSQEASLCDNSNLYNILTRLNKYYAQNRNKKNCALYENRALYIPRVKFDSASDEAFIDVIVCSAPNKTVAQRFCQKSAMENTAALTERIPFMLNVANHQHVNTLILGAWGCGGCGQNSAEVAKIFKNELFQKMEGTDSLKYPYLENVIFAVPYLETSNVYFDFAIAFPEN